MKSIADAKSDEALVLDHALTGSQESLGALVDRHWPLAHRLAYRVLLDPGAAEDAAQDAFVALIRASKRFQGGRSFAPWFRAIVLNTARKHARKRATRRRHEAAVGPQSASEDETLRRLEIQEQLAALPEDIRRPMELRFFAGHTLAEVGEALGCPRDTARSRIDRGLDRLRRALSRGGASISAARLVALISPAEVPLAPAAPSTLALTRAAGLSLKLAKLAGGLALGLLAVGLALQHRPRPEPAPIDARLAAIGSEGPRREKRPALQRAGQPEAPAAAATAAAAAAPPTAAALTPPAKAADKAPAGAELLIAIRDAKGRPAGGAEVLVFLDRYAAAGLDSAPYIARPPRWSKAGKRRFADPRGQVRVRSTRLAPGLAVYVWARSGLELGHSASVRVESGQTRIAIQLRSALRVTASTGALTGGVLAGGAPLDVPLVLDLKRWPTADRGRSAEELPVREPLLDKGARYALDDLTPGSYRLRFSAAGFAPVTIDARIEAGATTRADVRFELEESRLEGRVRLPAGLKASALKLSLRKDELWLAPRFVAEDGRFAFAPLGTGRAVLSVAAPGYQTRKRTSVITGPGLTDLGVIDLTDGARISGRLVDLAGRPLPGEPLVIAVLEEIPIGDEGTMIGELGHELTTDERGRFELRRALPGRFKVNVLKPGAQDRSFLAFDIVTAVVEDAVMGLDDLELGDLRVDRQAAELSLSGRVLGPSGVPVPARVCVRSSDAGDFGVNARCDADGRFTVRGLAPGPVLVNASFEELTTPRPLPLELSAAETEVTIALIKGAEVFGRVLGPVKLRSAVELSIQPDGEHAAFGTSARFVDTDAFRFRGLAPGAYILELEGRASPLRLVLEAGEPRRVDFDLSGARAALTVRVRGMPADARARALARWRLGPGQPELRSRANVDEESGAAVLEHIRPGLIELEVSARWFESREPGGRSMRAQLLRWTREVQARDGGRLTMDWPGAALGRIEGRVSPGGEDWLEVEALGVGVAAEAEADRDGRFWLVVPAGDYQVRLKEGGAAPVSVRVVAGKASALDRPLSRRP